MEEIMYEFGFSSSGGGGNYSDDHNLLAAEYFGWPTAFSDGAVPMESVGNVMAREVLSAANNSVVVDNTCSNLQEDQKNNIQAKISSHPLFPKLLLTYLDCHKVGAPTEIVNMLDNIVQENDLYRRSSSTALNRPISDDSELDDFMVSYCDVLAKFKSDLARSFNEATTFLNDVQTQLTNLCTTTNISGAEAEEGDSIGDEKKSSSSSSSSDEMCRESSEIRDKLMGKYSGYIISSLKQEFCNKNKKGKLPREATQILLNWWTTHYNWPYPTEGDKVYLAESTGLDPKQINNWFINQRKRHWKPSENMQFAVMETIYGHFSQ